MTRQALYLIPMAIREKIDKALLAYPKDKKQSALIYALKLLQKENGGYLPEPVLEAVAHYLELPSITVFEVASFYSQFELKKVGKHVLYLCTKVSCFLNGVDDLLVYLKERLGIGLGETTADGLITLKGVECLGACEEAPLLQYQERNYPCLTQEKLCRLLEEFKA